MPLVEIRFNTNFPQGKSRYEWRVLVDGVEYLVNEVEVACSCHTSSRFIEGEGMKWHISANAKKVDFEQEGDVKYAYIV